MYKRAETRKICRSGSWAAPKAVEDHRARRRSPGQPLSGEPRHGSSPAPAGFAALSSAGAGLRGFAERLEGAAIQHNGTYVE